MKKYYTTIEYILYNKHRINYSNKKNKKFKNHKKRVNEFTNRNKDYQHQIKEFKGCKKIKLPNNFSIINNPEGFIDFATILKETLDSGNDCNIDGSHIEYLTPDAIPVLIAFISQLQNLKGIIKGGFLPIKNDLKELWCKTGFEDIFKTTSKIYNNSDFSGIINYRTSKSYKSEYSTEIIQYTTQQLFGEVIQLPAIWQILSELIMNAFEHSADKEGFNDWRASVICDKPNKIAKFTFIDTGKGIANTMRKKFVDYFKYSNEEMIKLVFEGKKNITRTKIENRGYGLKYIYDFCKEKYVKNLIFVFNDVYVDIEKNIYKKLDKEFNGTFIYWEYDDGCYR